MSDDFVINRGKTINIAGVDRPIIDRNVPIAVPDLFVENRQSNGIVTVSLATTIADGNNIPEVHVCARLRMDIVFAQLLRDALTDLIDNAMTKPEKSKAN